ncbi:MAG: class I SAM-dependent methyltransferase [Clostridiales bacterium]|nr:class I SAM-dependent methyltransferase [Clostridiales bacterium]
MNSNVEYWDEIYKSKKNKKPDYDLWLNKYINILNTSKNDVILDLGCGSGGDTLYLHERNYKVLSCDYSEKALEIVEKYIPDANILKVDIANKLPFQNDSFKVIIADLSLHYFNMETTKNIILELERVLTINGYLLLRLNSINDVNYGAGEGQEIEKHFYLGNTGYKRFFDEKDIREFFAYWEFISIKEENIIRYGSNKKLYEVVLKNKEGKNE